MLCHPRPLMPAALSATLALVGLGFGVIGLLLGFLGGRETYVVDAKGKVAAVHNAQLDVESHVTVALDAIRTLPRSDV